MVMMEINKYVSIELIHWALTMICHLEARACQFGIELDVINPRIIKAKLWEFFFRQTHQW